MNNRLHSSFPESIHNKIPITKNNYQDLIIDAPISNFKTKRDSFRFVIDSRDRDYQKYPNPNNYVIPLTNEIRGVTSIELVKGCIPNSQYNINHTNNTLHYKLEDNCELIYQMSQWYKPELSKGIVWNDKTLAITWPIEMSKISSKDLSLPNIEQSLKELELN